MTTDSWIFSCVEALHISPDGHEVFVLGESARLDCLEVAVLTKLANDDGRACAWEDLSCRGPDDETSSRSGVYRVIHRLRMKVQPYGSAVETIRGFGYRLDRRYLCPCWKRGNQRSLRRHVSDRLNRPELFCVDCPNRVVCAVRGFVCLTSDRHRFSY